MKFCQTEAIVLRSREHKEADRVVTLFSRDLGKLHAISYGSARPTSKKRGAVQLFCRSRFYLVRSKEIYRIDQAELLERFPAVESNLERFAAASYFVELVDAFTGEEIPNQKLYHLLLKSLRLLAEAEIPLLTRAFELRLLKITGFGPELYACTGCRETLFAAENVLFCPQSGGLLCTNCRCEGSAIAISRGTLKVLRYLAAGSLEQVLTLKVPPPITRELYVILTETVAFHLGYLPQALMFLEQLHKTSP